MSKLLYISVPGGGGGEGKGREAEGGCSVGWGVEGGAL